MKNEKVDYTGTYIVKIDKLEKEIARLTAESTKWESKFYDEAKKVDKAIEYIRQLEFESEELYDISEIARLELLDILKGSDED